MSADLRDGQFYDGCRKASERGFLNIIGISAGYHDSACCLMQRGRIVAAAQEERFSRIKNDKAFPAAAFRYCLDQAGLTIADIECVAFYEDPCLKLSPANMDGDASGFDATAARRDPEQDIMDATRNRNTSSHRL
jgi:predicted NodU family carbamoyl transferase